VCLFTLIFDLLIYLAELVLLFLSLTCAPSSSSSSISYTLLLPLLQDGNTPSHLAVLDGHTNAIRLLWEKVPETFTMKKEVRRCMSVVCCLR
jgi:hypothetical protein